MGEVREVDAIGQAIVATEREIAGEAWDLEDTDLLDETGDRALESMGGGLEGQHEAEDDGEAEGSEEQDSETDEEAEGEEGEEGEGEAEAEAALAEGQGDQSQQRPQQTQQQEPQGRIPSGKYREVAERARLAEEERDRLKAQLEGQPKADPKLAALEAQVTTLTQLLQGRQAPQAPAAPEQQAAPEAPDIFENPKGFADHIQKGFETKLDGMMAQMRQNAVSTSFELAHVRHGEAFSKAMESVNKLNPNDPSDRKTVQDIYNSANPGEALVNWHRRSETLARVGPDPAAFEERIRNETRQALLKDPQFRQELLASIRGEAQTGDNGSPRTQNRLPPSLKRAPGASSQAQRFDHQASDDSDQSVADAAWR